MRSSPILHLVLSFAVLALAILSFGEPDSPVWSWAVICGAALAAVVFAGGWSERRRVLAELMSSKVGTFVLAEMVLPVLVVVAAIAAALSGDALVFDAAVVLAVTLAIFSLL